MFSFFGFIYAGSVVWIVVLAWLSLYLIITLWVFLYRFFTLKKSINREKESLNSIINYQSNAPTSDTIFGNSRQKASRELLLVWKTRITKNSTAGLVTLSVISSTSPFIGLFGTVVEILDTFSHLGGQGGVMSLDVIAPIISQALVATAAGILVAIPAYSFYMILKRKAFDWMTIVTIQSDILSAEQKLKEREMPPSSRDEPAMEYHFEQANYKNDPSSDFLAQNPQNFTENRAPDPKPAQNDALRHDLRIKI